MDRRIANKNWINAINRSGVVMDRKKAKLEKIDLSNIIKTSKSKSLNLWNLMFYLLAKESLS